MSSIPKRLRRSVVQRAENRCEYCRLSQEGQEATFHVDHVVPVVDGGSTTLANLALACVSCSLRKGARQVVKDFETGKSVSIFSPRQNQWNDHFEWVGVVLSGLTETGRATITALDLNRSVVLAVRAEEVAFGRHF